MRRRLPLFRDQRGATAAEFALVLPIFLLFLLGLIDVGRYSWSVNQSEKATQIGARWAVATDVVPAGASDTQEGLYNYSFAISGGIPQGTVVPASAFGGIRCSQATTAVACSCPVPGETGACVADWTDTPDQVAFDRIVRRMQLIYPAIRATDVIVDYTYSGLGFSGDPNGPDVSPLVTVRLGKPGNPMSFPMLFMLGRRVAMPSFSYAQTLEDAAGVRSN